MPGVLGLVTPYARRDATYIALRLASFASDLGWDTRIFGNRVARRTVINPVWDKSVVDVFRVKSWSWLDGLDVVVTSLIDNGVLADQARKRKCRCVALVLPSMLSPASLVGLKHYDLSVCLSHFTYNFLRKSGIRSSAIKLIPADPGLPLTRHRIAASKHIRVFWPFWFDACGEQIASVAAIWPSILRAIPRVRLTVALQGAPPSVRNILRKFLKRFTSQVVWKRWSGWYHSHLEYGRHDVTFWPIATSDTGWTALTSRAAGTPVIAIDHPVAREVVTHNRGGLLFDEDVSCAADDLGNIHVEPSLKSLQSWTYSLLREPDIFAALASVVHDGLAERTDLFHLEWKKILESV